MKMLSHLYAIVLSHHSPPGVTPVDGSPGKAYTDCYPVLLDGAMVGWVETELAPFLADSLRRFKVRQGIF